MDNKNLNKVENAVNEVQWKVHNYADRARDYIQQQRNENKEPTEEGWLNEVKNNVADAWEDTKDAASNVWAESKTWANDTWEKTKDAAEDVKAEIKKATN